MEISETYIGMFTIEDPVDGSPTDADSTPVGTIYKNGEPDTALTLTVTESSSNPSLEVGVYKVIANDSWENGSFVATDKVDIFITATVNSTENNSRIDSFILTNGVSLSSTGLNNISVTEPSGRASTFREMLVQTWMRFFNKSTLTSDTLTTYDAAGTTPVTTQSVADDGTTKTVNEAQ